MRKICFIFTLLLLFLTVSGCHTQGYRLIHRGDSYYIVLSSDHTSPEATHSPGAVPAGSIFYGHPEITFTSFDEMLSDIRTGNFTEEELSVLRFYAHPETEEIPICDLSNLYQATFPSDFDCSIRWGVFDYVIIMSQQDGSTYADLSFTTEEVFNSNLDRLENYRKYIRASEVDSEVSVTRESERGATVYSWTDTERVLRDNGEWEEAAFEKKAWIYSFDVEGNPYHVEETYDSSLSCPYHIVIKATLCGQYVSIHISGLTERPSVEWLSQFGLKEYDETSAS